MTRLDLVNVLANTPRTIDKTSRRVQWLLQLATALDNEMDTDDARTLAQTARADAVRLARETALTVSGGHPVIPVTSAATQSP